MQNMLTVVMNKYWPQRAVAIGFANNNSEKDATENPLTYFSRSYKNDNNLENKASQHTLDFHWANRRFEEYREIFA